MSAGYYASRSKVDWVGLTLVVLAHVAVLAWLLQQRIVSPPRSLEPLFVHFMTPEAPPPPKPPQVVKREPPKPKPHRVVPPPEPERIVVEAPPATPEEPVAPPPPPPLPVVEAPVFVPAPAPVPVPKSIGPVTLADELSVTCPERSPPAYPLLSRRLKEQGRVLLRVELDEQGRVATARIEKPSGATRLDEAALAAVRTWRCIAPTRDGKPMRAIALQPFDFVLQ